MLGERERAVASASPISRNSSLKFDAVDISTCFELVNLFFIMSKHVKILNTKKYEDSHSWLKTEIFERPFRFRPKKLTRICAKLVGELSRECTQS